MRKHARGIRCEKMIPGMRFSVRGKSYAYEDTAVIPRWAFLLQAGGCGRSGAHQWEHAAVSREHERANLLCFQYFTDCPMC